MIQLSPSAVREVTRMKSKHQNPNLFLRLGVERGGCSGLYYTLELDDNLKPDDHVFNCSGLKVAIAAKCLNYIANLTLDYSEDLMGGSFRFHNPQATTKCSCGHSFSMPMDSFSEKIDKDTAKSV
ncbi:MAG: iron-sulfur cluster assembly accessory protein [Oscillatoriaceae bacterium SKW80]|nr:iron-sulfur cluster assembly accessory protein [Oscillatoriaceae bacterium SKYG93]MCX8120700.1 iron-sulfur cluster assembly accessory protein [Oscillatoriaceae bacterium SKW80]MDW8453762.1 iron-sulfur cluster assembly accessory protein [Oscillatoriaceae cyanobacterium SKYGB_i_bin93]HIK26992.1 iron-sulfur cluster assembly accessory protein [Oscillatoriaceae cyanobacterium M7585_C2015_266]